MLIVCVLFRCAISYSFIKICRIAQHYFMPVRSFDINKTISNERKIIVKSLELNVEILHFSDIFVPHFQRRKLFETHVMCVIRAFAKYLYFIFYELHFVYKKVVT